MMLRLPVLIGSNLALLALAVILVTVPVDVETAGKVPAQPLALAVKEAPPVYAGHGASTRSLFTRIELPLPPSAPSTPAISPPAPPREPVMRLVGILTAAQEPIAYVVIEGQPELKRLRIGDALGSWRLEEVAARSILLLREGEARRLPLDPPQP